MGPCVGMGGKPESLKSGGDFVQQQCLIIGDMQNTKAASILSGVMTCYGQDRRLDWVRQGGPPGHQPGQLRVDCSAFCSAVFGSA